MRQVAAATQAAAARCGLLVSSSATALTGRSQNIAVNDRCTFLAGRSTAVGRVPVLERLFALELVGRSRLIGAGGGFLSERPVYPGT
jgi:hypothetical protein